MHFSVNWHVLGSAHVTSCCDKRIRSYYSTSISTRGTPQHLLAWNIYDPRMRPWYIQQANERTMHNKTATWSAPYPFATDGQIGITATGSIVVSGLLYGTLGALCGSSNLPG